MNTEEIFQQVMNENCKDPLYRFAELVRQDEREACAKIADSNRRNMQFLASDPPQSAAAWDIAVKIRGRTE